jgi:hypothetical protein
VPDDRGAAQAFEDANLDFLRVEPDQAVESGAEAFERFARQSDDEIGVNVDAGAGSEESEIVFEPFGILAAFDQPPDLFVESLNADLEL